MNLCITGALGHIGSKLIRNLQIPGLKKVYLVDNLMTQRYASLFELPDNVHFIFKETDILSSEMKQIIEDSDALIHLAAVTDAERSFERTNEIEDINKNGLERVARLCANANCAILFPSSTSVYGSQKDVMDETCTEDELKPQSPYADSKIFGERLLAELSHKMGLNYLIFRIGTIFGYSIGMRFHTAVNKFIWQASTDLPITVWKTALHQKRPYCGLSDCINAINFFVTHDHFDNNVYNIVTANCTVQEIVHVIKTHIPGLEVSLVDSPIMNQLSYEVSSSRSRNLGLSYHDSIEESLLFVMGKLKNVNSEIERIGI
jgi:UDP-glucose 4-epimerase